MGGVETPDDDDDEVSFSVLAADMGTLDGAEGRVLLLFIGGSLSGCGCPGAGCGVKVGASRGMAGGFGTANTRKSPIVVGGLAPTGAATCVVGVGIGIGIGILVHVGGIACNR